MSTDIQASELAFCIFSPSSWTWRHLLVLWCMQYIHLKHKISFSAFWYTGTWQVMWNIWCYSIKKRKYINSKIYFTAGRALQHLWQTVWGPDTYTLWTAKKQFLGTLLPTRTTHISLAKMFSQCISHLGFFSSASSWKLRLFANCLGFIPQSLLIDS